MFSTAPPSHAGLLLEPFAGYSTADGRTETPTSTVKGIGFGARAGLWLQGFSFGVDYDMRSLEEEFNEPTDGSLEAQTYDFTDLGVFLGYEFEFGFRLYASYFFNSTLEYSPVIAGLTELTGSGFKVGVGFVIAHLVSLNVEFKSNKYTEAKFETGTLDIDGEADVLGFYLSFPLVIGERKW